MSAITIPAVNARLAQKPESAYPTAARPENLKIKIHFENQVVTGFRASGESLLLMRLPVGILPTYIRYDEYLETRGESLLGPTPTIYKESAYGDEWELSGINDEIIF